MKVAYITGKISGDDNYYLKFEKAEIDLHATMEYVRIINPARLDKGKKRPWIWYIVRDCYIIWNQATHLVVLPDWRDSVGSQIEILVAKKRGLTVTFI